MPGKPTATDVTAALTNVMKMLAQSDETTWTLDAVRDFHEVVDALHTISATILTAYRAQASHA